MGGLGQLAQHLAFRVAQNAAAGALLDIGFAILDVALFIHIEAIVAAAEEGEMVIPDPAEKLDGFCLFLQRGRRVGGFEVRDRHIHGGAHIGPVIG